MPRAEAAKEAKERVAAARAVTASEKYALPRLLPGVRGGHRAGMESRRLPACWGQSCR